MIWMLDSTPEAIAQALDDRNLSRMIKENAQVLCQVHFQWIDYHAMTLGDAQHLSKNIPIQEESVFDQRRNEWADFGYKCLANYRYLCELGAECCREWSYRSKYFKNIKGKLCGNWLTLKDIDNPLYRNNKHQHVIEWCIQNQPELSLETPKESPDTLVTTINHHREKYQHKLNKGLRRKVRCKECMTKCYFRPENYEDDFYKCEACTLYPNAYGKIVKPIIPKWTRREKPDFLTLNLGDISD